MEEEVEKIDEENQKNIIVNEKENLKNSVKKIEKEKEKMNQIKMKAFQKEIEYQKVCQKFLAFFIRKNSNFVLFLKHF